MNTQASLGKAIKSFTLTEDQNETLESIAIILNENKSETLGQLLEFFETFILRNPQVFQEKIQLINRKNAMMAHQKKLEEQLLLDRKRLENRKQLLKEREQEKKEIEKRKCEERELRRKKNLYETFLARSD